MESDSEPSSPSPAESSSYHSDGRETLELDATLAEQEVKAASHHQSPSAAWVLNTEKGANVLRWEEAMRSSEQAASPSFRPPFTQCDPVQAIEDVLLKVQPGRDLQSVLMFGNNVVLYPRKKNITKPTTPKRALLYLKIGDAYHSPLNKNDFAEGLKKKLAIQIKINLRVAEQSDASLDAFIKQTANFFNRIPIPPAHLTLIQQERIVQFVGAQTMPDCASEVWKRSCRINIHEGKAAKTYNLSVTSSLLDPVVLGFTPTSVGEGAKTRVRNDFVCAIPVKAVDLNTTIPEPDARVTITAPPEQSLLTKAGTILDCTVQQQTRALLLAKHIASSVALAYGTRQQLIQFAMRIRDQHMLPSKAKKSYGDPLHYGGAPLFFEGPDTAFVVLPSDEIRRDLPTIPRIEVRTILTKKRVMGRIIEVWRDTCRIERAWLEGCELADLVAVHGSEALIRECSCDVPIEHTCDGCLRLRPCAELQAYEQAQLRLCEDCAKKTDFSSFFEVGEAKGDPLAARIHELSSKQDAKLAKNRGSVVTNAMYNFNEELRLYKIPFADAKDDREEYIQRYTELRGPLLPGEGSMPEVEWNDPFTRDPVRRPLIHSGGANPFTMSVACKYPCFLHKGRLRSHIAINAIAIPFYLNLVQWIYPFLILRIIYEFSRMRSQKNYQGPSRAELIERLEHLHLIVAQVGYNKNDRANMRMDETQWKLLLHQMETGIADQKVCESSVPNPWILKGRLHNPQYDFHNMAEEDLPNLAGLKACIAEIEALPGYDPSFLPKINGVPYPFEVGPPPKDWSWKLCYRLFSTRVEMIIKKCNKRYVTTITVPVLILILCYQVVRRRLPDCPKGWQELFNLPLGLHAQSCVSVSFGKITHGQEMTSGLKNPSEVFDTLDDFDFDDCNIIAESWGANMAKNEWNSWEDRIQEHINDFPIGANEFLPEKLTPLPRDWHPRDFSGSTRVPPRDIDVHDIEGPSSLNFPPSDQFSGTQETTNDGDARNSPTLSTRKQAIYSRDPSESLHSSDVPVSRRGGILARRNMTNETNTCYASAAVQILSALDPFRSVILSSEGFSSKRYTAWTGVSKVGETEAEKERREGKMQQLQHIGELKTVLKSLFDKLHQTGSPLPQKETDDLRDGMNAIDPTQYNAGGFDDSNLFLFDLIDYIIKGSDKSEPHPTETDDTIAAENRKLWEGGKAAPTFSEDLLKRHRQGVANSGSRTPIFDAICIAIYTEKVCGECMSIDPAFIFSECMQLDEQAETPLETPHHWQQYDLEELIDAYFAPRTYGNKLHCPLNKSHAGTHVIHRHLAMLPKVLFLRFDRVYASSQGSNIIRLNDVITPENLNLHDLYYAGIPSGEGQPVQKEDVITEYYLHAFNVYIASARHYVAYVRERASSSSEWLLFDDKQSTPRRVGKQPWTRLTPGRDLIVLWTYLRNLPGRPPLASSQRAPSPTKKSAVEPIKRTPARTAKTKALAKLGVASSIPRRQKFPTPGQKRDRPVSSPSHTTTTSESSHNGGSFKSANPLTPRPRAGVSRIPLRKLNVDTVMKDLSPAKLKIKSKSSRDDKRPSKALKLDAIRSPLKASSMSSEIFHEPTTVGGDSLLSLRSLATSSVPPSPPFLEQAGTQGESVEELTIESLALQFQRFQRDAWRRDRENADRWIQLNAKVDRVALDLTARMDQLSTLVNNLVRRQEAYEARNDRRPKLGLDQERLAKLQFSKGTASDEELTPTQGKYAQFDSASETFSPTPEGYTQFHSFPEDDDVVMEERTNEPEDSSVSESEASDVRDYELSEAVDSEVEKDENLSDDPLEDTSDDIS